MRGAGAGVKGMYEVGPGCLCQATDSLKDWASTRCFLLKKQLLLL